MLMRIFSKEKKREANRGGEIPIHLRSSFKESSLMKIQPAIHLDRHGNGVTNNVIKNYIYTRD